MEFEPNYRHILDVATNKRPARLPLYEHIISPKIMERILGVSFAEMECGSESDQKEFFKHYCRFFKEMTYDTVSYEVCMSETVPVKGALLGGHGPIQNRSDFEKYPWNELPKLYWQAAEPRFDALVENLPEGMKIVGGVGNGVFEMSEDFVGLESLAYMQIDDPQLFNDLYDRIGDLMLTLWDRMLKQYGRHIVLCRFGDDLGHKSGTLTSPDVIRNNIIPQYQKVIGRIKQDKPFLWHSCGCIFDIMDDVIKLGINAKHSNEDAIAPFDKWIELYSDKIGLLGGIDVDLLCQKSPEEIAVKVIEDGTRFRNNANGFALGSGNSIPDYVPVDGYLAMIEGVKQIRESETDR